MANAVGHFEFMVSDTKKAKDFYGKVFDWKFQDSPHYTMIETGADPKGGIMKKPAEAPHFALNVYFYTTSIDETLKKVQSAGGKVLIGKTQIDVGWWAMFCDPDGIPVGLFQTK